MKTVGFKDPRYVGDPINAVRIFNEKFVDEIVFLDIAASKQGRGPDFDHLRDIASECFIPFCYGGGVTSIDDAAVLFRLGVEKVAVNSSALANPGLVTELSERFGAQSVVVSLDFEKGFFGKHKVKSTRGNNTGMSSPEELCRFFESKGAGELLITSIAKDGRRSGYDLDLLGRIPHLSIPVIANGGAGDLDHVNALRQKAEVSAAAAGSMFVFRGKHRAVLISYPSRDEIRRASL